MSRAEFVTRTICASVGIVLILFGWFGMWLRGLYLNAYDSPLVTSQIVYYSVGGAMFMIIGIAIVKFARPRG